MARRAEQVVDELLDLVLGQRLQVDAVEMALAPQHHDRVRGRLVAPDRQEQRRHARGRDRQHERGRRVVEQLRVVDEHGRARGPGRRRAAPR